MGRKCLVIVILFCSTVGYSQEFKRFAFGISLGYPGTLAFKGGALLSLEPTYRVGSALSFGLRLQGTAMVIRDGNSTDFTGVGSYGVFGDYQFTSRSIKPIVGLGIGFFRSSIGMGEMCDCHQTTDGNTPGLFPRLGFNYGHLMFRMEYNFIKPSRVTSQSIIPGGNNTAYTHDYNINYFALTIGMRIGGGRKKPLIH